MAPTSLTNVSSSGTSITTTVEVPSSSSNGRTSAAKLEKQGCLEATVLSVYDLPYSERPISVSLSACGMTVKSHGPVARHRDRNSYRFAASGASPINANGSNGNGSTSSSDVIKLVAPLRELYRSQLKVTILYNNAQQYLETEFSLRQLRIHENKWLILNLTPSAAFPPPPPSSNSSHALTSAASTASSLPEDDMAPPPTIRIKLKLSGPYRAEIAALVGLGQAWFGVVDKMEDGSKSALRKVPTVPPGYNKFLLIPLVPVVAAIVVASPVIAGVAMVGLPFVLPVVLVAIFLLAGGLVSGAALYSSTRAGRAQVGGYIGPIIDQLLHSRAGQALVYDTGPRPTPVSVCRQVLPQGMWSKLFLSLLIDLIGSCSYLLPVVGEGLDLAWAPIQTIFIMSMYDSTSPNLKYVSFIEEVMPFTDIVPTATIGWACEFVPAMLSDSKVPPEMTQAVSMLVTSATGTARTGTSTTQS